MNGPTLNQVLRALGYTTRPAPNFNQYAKDILRGGAVVFTGCAGDVWAWLRGEATS